MRNYQNRRRRQREHEPADLQWLEDGINVLISFTIKGVTGVFSALWALVVGEPKRRH